MYGWTPESTAEMEDEVIEMASWEEEEEADCAIFHGYIISLSELILYFQTGGMFELTCACEAAFAGSGGRHGGNDGGGISEMNFVIGIFMLVLLYYHYSITYGVKWNGKAKRNM